MIYAAIADWAENNEFPVDFMCTELEVSRSGYYAWRTRPFSHRALTDIVLTARIRRIHAAGRGNPGVRRIRAEGIRCGVSVSGVESQTDLIRVAAHSYVTQLEEQFNNGQAFPDPGTNNHRGSGPHQPGQWVKVGVRLPLSLHQRIMAAARFLDDTGLVPEVTSANRLITAALDASLTELERDHNRGKPFHDPRHHLPKGRLPGR